MTTPFTVAAGEMYMATHSWDNTDAMHGVLPGVSLSPNLTWLQALYGIGSDVLPDVAFGADLAVDVVYRPYVLEIPGLPPATPFDGGTRIYMIPRQSHYCTDYAGNGWRLHILFPLVRTDCAAN